MAAGFLAIVVFYAFVSFSFNFFFSLISLIHENLLFTVSTELLSDKFLLAHTLMYLRNSNHIVTQNPFPFGGLKCTLLKPIGIFIPNNDQSMHEFRALTNHYVTVANSCTH